MSLTHIYQNKFKEHQLQTKQESYVYEIQPKEKDIEINKTLPNQKALEWLRTQFYEKEWEVHEYREEIIQKAKNGKPIIVLNYVNYSEDYIRTMVENVLNSQELGDDSSIFVVVPSTNDGTINSIHDKNSTICIQLSTNPFKWKHKHHPVEQAANHDVKMSSKGKRFFLESLPVEILSAHDKDTCFDYSNPKIYEIRAKKNKLCQITTPDGVVRRLDHSCNVITDTTADRPCCCSLKTTHYSDYSPKDRYVAGVKSKPISPLLVKHDSTDNPCQIPRLGKNAPELVGQCRHHQAQHHRTPAQYHRNIQHDPRYNDQHAIVPAQYYTNPTSQYYKPCRAPSPDKSVPDLHHTTVPAQYLAQPTSQIVNPYLVPHPEKLYPNPHYVMGPSNFYTHPTSQYVNPCFAANPTKPRRDPHLDMTSSICHTNLTLQHCKPCPPLPAKKCSDPYPTEPCSISHPAEPYLNSHLTELSPNSYPTELSPNSYLTEPCPNSYLAEPCPNSYSAEPYPNSYTAETCPKPYPAEPCPKSYPVEPYLNSHDPQPCPDPHHFSSYIDTRTPYSNTKPAKPCPDLHHTSPYPDTRTPYPNSKSAKPCPAQRPNTKPAKPCPDAHPAEPCRNTHRAQPPSKSCARPQQTAPGPNTHQTPPCPDTHCNKPNTKSHRAKPSAKSHVTPPSPTQKTTNLLQMPSCQCSPEMMLDLLKIAVKGGNIEDLPSKGCENRATPAKPVGPSCQERSALTILAPRNEPEPSKCNGWKSKENDKWCPCGRPTGMQVETGETKQKQVSINETRFVATVGTSTEHKTPWYKPKWNKTTICECPEVEPELDLDALALQYLFHQGEPLEEMLKKRSLETQRVSGFRLNQKKKPPEIEYTEEDCIRYYAMMYPELFQSIMAEQQAKVDGKKEVRYSGRQLAVTPEPEETPAEDEGPFRGLKFKMGGKGTASKGLSGVCCFDLLHESFTTW